MSDQPPPKSWRYGLQLRMRTLMIVVLVPGCGLGWIVHTAHVQRHAVALIERTGGGVMYDWQFRNGIPNREREPWAPKWLVDLIGIDYFGNAVYVIGETRQIDNSILVPAGRLGRLERLELSNSAVTDAGLMQLAGLTHLHTLDLGGTDVGDAGLAHLKKLVSLKDLNLNATQVGDPGLMYLKDLTNLQTLYLGFTRVSDAGLVHLKGSINLEHLNLIDTQITDAGLVHLNDLTGLKSLYIGGTKISDGGLSYLKKTMLGLRILDLTNGDTNRPEKVTVAGVQVLQRARPNVRIDY